MTMDHIFQEITSIPGVEGAYIYNPQKGVVDRTMPDNFKDSTLETIGKSLIKIYSTSKTTFSDVCETTLTYKEAILIIREITNNYFLIAFSEPKSNLNILAMSLDIVMEKLKAYIDTPAQDHIETISSSSKKSAIPIETLREKDNLSEPLKILEKSLAKVMGPMAKIVFLDAVNMWQKENEPSASTIPDLISIIRNEIDDREKIDIYNRLIIKHFNF